MWIALTLVGLAQASTPDPAVMTAAQRLQDLSPQRRVQGLPTIPASAYEEAANGELAVGVVKVPEHRARKTWGVAVLDVPINRLWAAINDEQAALRHTPLRHVELLKGNACQSGREVLQVLDVDIPMVSDRWWITVRHPNASLAQATGGQAQELVWDSAPHSVVPSNTAATEDALRVDFTRGSWMLVEIDPGRTLVQYYVWADPGGNLDPKTMSWFAHKSVRNTFRDMATASKDPQLACVSG